MSSCAPHVGGAEFELPIWRMFFSFKALPTEIAQLFCEAASAAGVQEIPSAIGWTPDQSF